MTTANFTKPVVTDLRADVLQYIRDYMAAQAKMFDGDTLVSQPVNTIRYSSGNLRLEKWNGSVWAELPLMSFGNTITINTGASQPLSLQTSSATPWAMDLYRTDLSNSSRARNVGSRWDFEHRPSFAGNLAVDTANVGSYAPTLTGGGASGTWGINVSGSAASAASVPWSGVTSPPAITGLTADTAASANTVARRDGSGYLFATYFLQSSANNENPTVSQFMVTNGSDNHMRKANVAGVVAALNSTIAPVFANITSKPTTLAGYGITDAAALSGATFTGDITTYRSGAPTTGVIWLGNTGSRYLYYDGSGYVLANANLTINGQLALHAGNYNSYAAALSGATFTGAVSGTTFSASGLLKGNGGSKGYGAITTTTTTGTPTGGSDGDFVLVY